MRKSLFNFAFYSSLITVIIGCATKKNAAKFVPQEGSLNVSEVYTEKYIPGEQNQTTKNYLFVNITPPDPALSIDSIRINNATFLIKKDGNFFKAVLAEYQKEDKPPRQRATMDLLAPAKLYYHKDDGIIFYQYVDKIEIRQPVYLP